MADHHHEALIDEVVAERQLSRIHDHSKSPAGIDDLLSNLPKNMTVEVPGPGRVAFCDKREWVIPQPFQNGHLSSFRRIGNFALS